MQKESAALAAVTGELASIFKAGMPTDTEIDKWEKAYNPDAPIEAKREYVKQGISLMESRLDALGSDYERTMGRPFDGQLVSPKAQGIIQSIVGNGYGQNQGAQSAQVNDVRAQYNALRESGVPAEQARQQLGL
jgi:hypothetical protein